MFPCCFIHPECGFTRASAFVPLGFYLFPKHGPCVLQPLPSSAVTPVTLCYEDQIPPSGNVSTTSTADLLPSSHVQIRRYSAKHEGVLAETFFQQNEDNMCSKSLQFEIFRVEDACCARLLQSVFTSSMNRI